MNGAVAESYVIVWDVRHLRGNKATSNGAPAWSVPLASPPLLLHFLPAFSGRAVASAGDGLVALLHVNNAQEDQAVFQVSCIYTKHLEWRPRLVSFQSSAWRSQKAINIFLFIYSLYSILNI